MREMTVGCGRLPLLRLFVRHRIVLFIEDVETDVFSYPILHIIPTSDNGNFIHF